MRGSRKGRGSGLCACTEVRMRQWWAVAFSSWALTSPVLQLQSELWRLGNGSQPNYNDWLPVCWRFSDSVYHGSGYQRCVCVCMGGHGVGDVGRGGNFSLVFSSHSLLENRRRLRSDWLARIETSRDLATLSWWESETGDVAMMVSCTSHQRHCCLL